MSIEVITFGCRLNSYESTVMKQKAIETKLNSGNFIIFNSCAVTNEAERQLRQAIRKASKQNPAAKIIVTGCAAQINPEKYLAMPEVYRVWDNAQKLDVSNYLQLAPELATTQPVSTSTLIAKQTDNQGNKTRAFLEIQNGCDHSCTFCIIPYGRGKSRSVPIGEIVQQAHTIIRNGYHELVFTGVDITSYGLDLPGQPSLAQMVKRLLMQVSSISRIRFSSLDVAELGDDFIELLAQEKRLMPHLHLSLQSGDDIILKRMKRRHLRQDILSFCNKVRQARPEVVFGADIIAGFPTETDKMFYNTLQLIYDANLTYLHVFPYSEREGTPAVRMPQVALSVRKHRAEILRKVGEEMLQKHYMAQIGKEVTVLIEQNNIGHAEDFGKVKLDIDDPVYHNKLITCKIVGYTEKYMIASA